MTHVSIVLERDFGRIYGTHGSKWFFGLAFASGARRVDSCPPTSALQRHSQFTPCARSLFLSLSGVDVLGHPELPECNFHLGDLGIRYTAFGPNFHGQRKLKALGSDKVG